MTDERFSQLLNGPLSHQFPLFRLTRLVLALRDVVDSTGQAGEDALERHCRAREEQDLANEGA